MTTAQDSQVFVPCVGADQPCRILARPSDAGHLSEGAWILRGAGVRVTNLAMMVYALGRYFTMEAIFEKYRSMVVYSTTRKRDSQDCGAQQARTPNAS